MKIDLHKLYTGCRSSTL